MDFKEYQQAAEKTAIYPEEHKIVYPTLGLNGEAGEVAEKVKKAIRDEDGVFDIDAMVKEIGDVLWYLSALCSDLNISLDGVAKMNIEKLYKRKQNNTLKGSGDNR